jgi:2-dehydro-3-deoxyphosphooctonate aldolase (KDO 8-P synthase)
MTQHAHITAGNVTFGNDMPLALIAGPCQMESRDHAMDMAGALVEIAKARGIGLVYKTSYDKANRTSLKGVRGMGLEKSLAVFAEIKCARDCALRDYGPGDRCAANPSLPLPPNRFADCGGEYGAGGEY